MTDRQFKPDLTGTDETLEHLLDRLRSFRVSRPVRQGPKPPPDRDYHFNSRRPLGGAGGAEAPIPRETPLPDCYAPI
jgi:hypothetical protein